MGVYIKGMTLGELNDCVMVGAYIAPEDAVEVTEPHGRLIDIRCVEDNKFVAIESSSQRWWNGALDSIIDNVPTVIEAEGE